MNKWLDSLNEVGKTVQGFVSKPSSPPPAPSQPPAKQDMPAWLLPVGIGGVLVILAFAFGRGR